MSEPNDPFVIGCRIELASDASRRGTVSYVGQVHGTEGTWLGMDWDDTDGGKHDGSHDSVRYFTASAPTSGSFIRPAKASAGISFEQAMDEKYGSYSESTVETHLVGSKTIEMIGFEKVAMLQCDYSRLRQVMLSDTAVSGVHNQGVDLSAMVPRTVELDLSDTLLDSWERVLALCRNLKYLNTLYLSGNRLQLPLEAQGLPILAGVKMLVMNRTPINWDYIERFAPFVPSVEDFGLCGCRVSTLLNDVEVKLPHLVYLDLQENCLSEWGEVLKLGRLENLLTLNLSVNDLREVYFDDVEAPEMTSLFPKLRTLMISDNQISKWSTIDELNRLPSLRLLKIVRNPIGVPRVGFEKAYIREEMVARIARVENLDLQVVDRAERRGSEIDYLKTYSKDWADAMGPGLNIETLGDRKTITLPDTEVARKFARLHPRYMEIIGIRGPPDPASDARVMAPGVIKGSLRKMVLQFHADMKVKPVTRNLPDAMTVSKLRLMCGRLCKKDPRSLTLTYHSSANPGVEFELDNDYRQLTVYDLDEGDVIFVTQ